MTLTHFRRPIMLGVLLAGMLSVQPCFAQAPVWPSKPVKIVVTFPPGGAPDTLARILADKWGQTLGQTFTVDNKPGAGGNIGAEFVAKSASDGSTLIIGTVGTHTINPALYPNLPYNPVKDFTPITFLASTPNLLVVNNNVPAKNVKELIDLAKKQPLNFGSSGSGTSIHLSGELFNTLAGKHSLIVVEHDMDFVSRIARTVTVLHEGSVLAEGPMDVVQNDARVIEVYLGR